MSGEQPKDIKVSEAMALAHELNELVADMPSEEATRFLGEAATDPELKAAIEAQQMLQVMATGLNGAFRTAYSPSRNGSSEAKPPAPEPEPPVPAPEPRPDLPQISEAETAALLAEIHDNPEAREQAERRKQDIQSTHDLLTAYDQLRVTSNGNNGGPTKSQRRRLHRELRQLFEANWSAADLADDPWRIKQVMDSASIKEGISDDSRRDFVEFTKDRVKEYVKESAKEVHPDVIAERIKVCAEEGVSKDGLAPVLLKPYFKSVEGQDIDKTTENYERFLRGTIRTASDPATCKFAMEIAGFKTKLLPSESQYCVSALLAPQIRLDRPDIFGRRAANLKTLLMLKTYFDGVDPELIAMKSKPDLYTQAFETIKDKGLDEIVEELQAKGGFKYSLGAEALRVSQSLADEEIEARAKAVAEMERLVANHTTLLEESMDDAGILEGFEAMELFKDSDEYYVALSGSDLILRRIAETHPDQLDFIRAVLTSRSLVQDELPDYIPDTGAQLPDAMSLANHLDSLPSHVVEAVSEMSATAKQVEVMRRDGYVVEALLPKDAIIGEQERWAFESLIDSQTFEELKESLAKRSGIDRRYEAVVFHKPGLAAVIRPENEEDRKSIHPLESLLAYIGEFDEDDISDQELNLMIEGAAQALALNRRRFLNDRGIEYIYEAEDEEDVDGSILIEKHPTNPRAYIGTLKIEDQAVSFLVDPALRIRLGDRKVESKRALLAVNAMVAASITHFMCAEAVDTEDGTIGENSNAITKRIAHLHMLPKGEHYSLKRWEACLDEQGEDLEVLSQLQALLKGVDRNFTYYSAIEKDDPSLGPMKVKPPEEFQF